METYILLMIKYMYTHYIFHYRIKQVKKIMKMPLHIMEWPSRNSDQYEEERKDVTVVDCEG